VAWLVHQQELLGEPEPGEPQPDDAGWQVEGHCEPAEAAVEELVATAACKAAVAAAAAAAEFVGFVAVVVAAALGMMAEQR
jgi:hypothetical protein